MNEAAYNYFMIAQKLRQEGKIDASINALLAATKIAPDYAAAHHNLGFLYEQKGERPKALTEYRKAIHLDPALQSAHINLGALLLKIAGPSNLVEAIQVHQNAIRLFPENVKLHYNLGNAYVAVGQRALAISEYKQAVCVDPSFSDAYANLGRELAHDESWVAAVEAYQEALRIGPYELALHYALSNALIQARRTNEAIAEFRKILQSNPKDAECCFQLGRAYLIQSLQEESRESVHLAEQNLLKALSLKPYSLKIVKLLLQAKRRKNYVRL